ncbi:MAG: NmrA family NAD(P)-binding protein [Pseudomonadota bacterium]|nr:NmrA family NAD(P)-binding protein [Pseudomonadota bacterium]
MTILVIGGTGRVGSHAVKKIAAKSENIRVLSRSDDKIANLPEGSEGFVGNLEEPDSIIDGFKDAKKLLLITANGETETIRGINAVNSAASAKIEKIVFISVKLSEEAMKVPHYASKVPIEEAIKTSGITYTILRPDFFYQNDSMLGKAITAGFYTMPIGNKGQSRIDARDIADAAVNALQFNDLDNQEINLFGPKSWTADEIAAIYGKFLDRKVIYAGDDLNSWEESSKAFMPPWLLSALKLGFAKMQKMGSVASELEVKTSEETVGHELRTFEAFVKETTDIWKKNM